MLDQFSFFLSNKDKTNMQTKRTYHHESNWFYIVNSVSSQKLGLDTISVEWQMLPPLPVRHAQVQIESGFHEHPWVQQTWWWHPVTANRLQN